MLPFDLFNLTYMSKRYCLALDLKEDDKLILEYERMHQQVWPEIINSIKESGILGLEIYRLHTRLCMIIETADDFSFEKKSERDTNNLKVQEWETLMWKYQQALPMAKEGEKWMLMKMICKL